MAGPEDWGAVPADAQDAPTTWGAQPAGRQGGLLSAPFELAQTIPQFIGAMETPEGRSRLASSTYQAAIKPIIDFFKTPGEALEKGLTPEQETEFGVNAALGEAIGKAGQFVPKEITQAIHPVTQEFKDTVTAPAAQRVDSFARTGDPNGVRLEPPAPEVKPSPIKPIEDSPFAGVSRSILAKTGIPEVDGILFSPNTRAVVDNAVVDRTRDIPNSWGGSSDLNNPTTYLSHLFPKEMTIGGDPGKIMYQGVRSSRVGGLEPGMPQRSEYWTSNLEMARTYAGPDGFVRVARWNDFPQEAKVRGIDARGVASSFKLGEGGQPGTVLQVPELGQLPSSAGAEEFGRFAEPTPKVTFDPAEPAILHENIEHHVITILRAAGMPADVALSVAYHGWGNPVEHAWYSANGMNPAHVEAALRPILDRIATEKGKNVPDELFRGTYPDGDPQKASAGDVPKPTPEQAAQGLQIVRDWLAKQPQSAIPMLQEARELGVTVERQPVELDAEYQKRLEKWVGKIETTSDVKQAILQSVAENNQFEQSRAAMEIPLSHVERLADAAGIEAAQIDTKLLRTKFQTPEEIRTTEQLMLRLTDEAVEAGNAVARDATPENLAAHAEALTRRDLALEYVLNLRSEWGKAGHALQQILAKSMRGINDRETQARLLSEGAKAIPQPEWYYWIWMQGLLSGPFTHTKYLLANTVYAGMEHALTTPLAAMIGAVKKAAGADVDRVLFGEAMAENWGWITAFPDAIRGAAQSIKSGMRVPLASEKDLFDKMIERGEKPPLSLIRATSELQQPKPIPGVWGRVLGAPGDVASGIHTAFKIMGERAGADAWAYRQAANEGLKPTNGEFWNRMAYHKANVPVDVLQDTIFKAYKDTFMQPLGPHGQAWSSLVKKVPGLRWVFPFNHIPIDLIKATYEYTPAAGLDKEMRSSLLGREGGIKQDKAVARIIIGSAALAYFANKFMWGNATAEYPQDPQEQRAWKIAGKQPNSIRVGDSWYSFERFGPAGDLASIATNIASIAQHYDGQDEHRFTKSIWMAAHAAANTIANEVGFQSVRNAVDAIEDQRKGERWAAWQAGSFLPYSSFTSQTASFMDPSMREAKTFINGLKYRIPVLRQTLLPSRNPLTGEPKPNPGFETIIRTSPVHQDPVEAELDRIGLHPAAQRAMIGHTKLTPAQFDQLEATTGPAVMETLNAMINSPGWFDRPVEKRHDLAKAAITMVRKDAGKTFLMQNPERIQQGINIRNQMIQPTAP